MAPPLASIEPVVSALAATSAATFDELIATREARVGIVGLGYAGLPLGMAFAEALAHGLPVVGTRGGAVPDVVPPDAGILVPPGDPAALADALRGVIAGAALRARLAEGAARAGAALPRWADAAARVAAVL